MELNLLEDLSLLDSWWQKFQRLGNILFLSQVVNRAEQYRPAGGYNRPMSHSGSQSFLYNALYWFLCFTLRPKSPPHSVILTRFIHNVGGFSDGRWHDDAWKVFILIYRLVVFKFIQFCIVLYSTINILILMIPYLCTT